MLVYIAKKKKKKKRYNKHLILIRLKKFIISNLTDIVDTCIRIRISATGLTNLRMKFILAT